MEREATGERTRETIRHIRSRGYHFGKVPYGKQAVPVPENPRYKVLIDDPDEQAVLTRLKEWAAAGVPISEMATRLNADGVRPPQGKQWTQSLIYNLKLRLSWIRPRPHNQRPHTDEQLKERILELRNHGHTYRQIAAILNEQKWVPLKGRHFTERTIVHLIRSAAETKLLGPRQYLESVLHRMERTHAKESPDVPFQRPGFPKLAALLTEAGYVTPKGHARWWPAQVQQLLEGRFEKYYAARASQAKRRADRPEETQAHQ
ncbi:MAG: recombinase family protein [Polyangia bacterium]